MIETDRISSSEAVEGFGVVSKPRRRGGAVASREEETTDEGNQSINGYGHYCILGVSV